MISFFASLHSARRILWTLAKSDFRSRYFDSVLGVLWAFILPLFSVSVMWAAFQLGFRAGPKNGAPFFLWLITGLFPWTFFSEAVLASTNSILEKSFLVKKNRFPGGAPAGDQDHCGCFSIYLSIDGHGFCFYLLRIFSRSLLAADSILCACAVLTHICDFLDYECCRRFLSRSRSDRYARASARILGNSNFLVSAGFACQLAISRPDKSSHICDHGLSQCIHKQNLVLGNAARSLCFLAVGCIFRNFWGEYI